MLIVHVYNQVHERKATKKDGTEFTFQYQEAEIVRDGHRPRVIKISVPKQGRYEDGLYTLSADSFRPDKYERLEMGFPELTPLEVALKDGEKHQKAWQGRKVV
ncbi:MAG: single-stranded DNA-binding protein [Steroidobacteraceae bacterium]